jgi:hypothetical protein
MTTALRRAIAAVPRTLVDTRTEQNARLITRSSSCLATIPDVPFWDTRECAGDSSDVEDNPLQRSPKTESVVPLSCQYGR